MRPSRLSRGARCGMRESTFVARVVICMSMYVLEARIK